MAAIVVNPGRAQQHRRDVATAFAHHLFSADLRCAVRQPRVERRVLVDPLTERAGRMHDHRARIDELLDRFEAAGVQGAQQPRRALHGDRLVRRIGLVVQIEPPDQMDHRGDGCAVFVAHALQRGLHALVVGQVDLDRRGQARRRIVGRAVIEPDDSESGGEPSRDGTAEVAAGAGDEDEIAMRRRRHAGLLGSENPAGGKRDGRDHRQRRGEPGAEPFSLAKAIPPARREAAITAVDLFMF